MNTQMSAIPPEEVTSKLTTDDVIGFLAKGFCTELSEEEMQLVGQYYIESAPEVLFKYRPMINAHDIDAIKNGKMWFSELTTLNDPYEAYAKIDTDKFSRSVLNSDPELRKSFSKKSYALRYKAQKAAMVAIEQQSAEFLKDIRQDMSITCLSERNDSILMWGHYANMHRGICLAYDILEMSERLKTVIPVNYSDHLPALADSSEYGIIRFFIESLRTKASDWSYEKEWRCLQGKSACGESWCGNGALLDVPPPKAVYLGCRSSESQIEQMKKICIDLLKIPLYIMEQSQTEYQLLPKEIK